MGLAFSEHSYLLNSKHLNENDKIVYKRVEGFSRGLTAEEAEMNLDAIGESLFDLARLIWKHEQGEEKYSILSQNSTEEWQKKYVAQRPIVLIDEYDTPFIQLMHHRESEGVGKLIMEKRMYIEKVLS
jgi:hypothetical protein